MIKKVLEAHFSKFLHQPENRNWIRLHFSFFLSHAHQDTRRIRTKMEVAKEFEISNFFLIYRIGNS